MTIQINQELAVSTQKYHTECDGLAYLLSYMVKNNPDKDVFKSYEDRYFKAYENFENSKLLIEQEVKKYVPNVTSWSLDYTTGVVTVETK